MNFTTTLRQDRLLSRNPHEYVVDVRASRQATATVAGNHMLKGIPYEHLRVFGHKFLQVPNQSPESVSEQRPDADPEQSPDFVPEQRPIIDPEQSPDSQKKIENGI